MGWQAIHSMLDVECSMLDVQNGEERDNELNPLEYNKLYG